jgi:glycosyltransferase involved in cell wall biosynthesis
MLSIHKLYDPFALPQLVYILRSRHIDVLQTHLGHSNILGILAAKLAGVPVIPTLHSTHAQPSGHLFRLRLSLEYYLLRSYATRIVAVGRLIGDIFRSRLSGRTIDVILNPVKIHPALSTEKRDALRKTINNNASCQIILNVGRLKSDKGLADLISAFSIVHEKHSKAHLAIVGDGDLLSDLHSLASRLGVEDFVHFFGARNDVPDLLYASDLYVSSSHREGLSIAMLEAMAAGLPVLATNVGDSGYLLSEGRGVLVDPHDIDALALEMSRLLNQPAQMKLFGQKAHAFVEENFTLSSWFEKLITIYKESYHYGR